METGEPVIIWGAGGHAEVVADIVELEARYRIAGFLDDAYPDRWGTSFCGATVLGGQAVLGELLDRGIRRLIVAIGDGRARLSLAELATSRGFVLASAIHPRAIIARSARIGAGTVVAAGAVIGTTATLGMNVIVNTGATVDHGCTVADGAHICPGVHLAGRVQVGRAAWVGIGSTVKEGVVIGDGATLGAGSVVIRAIPPGALAFGVPAKVVKQGSQP